MGVMRARLVRLVGLLSILGVAVTAAAQYGHPLKGTWSGDWGTGPDDRHRLLLQFDWDGETITGTINPGPDAVPLKEASLDPSTWSVHLEAEGRDGAGSTVRYVIDGELQNLGSAHRVITGSWTEGGVTGDFTIKRN